MGRDFDPADVFCAQSERALFLCPVLRRLLSRWTALVDDEAFRGRCRALVDVVTAAHVSPELERRRRFMFLDWALRRVTSGWFVAAGLEASTEAIRRYPPVTGLQDVAALGRVLAEARTAVTEQLLRVERTAQYDVGSLTAAVARAGRECGWYAAWAVATLNPHEQAEGSAVWFDAWCAVADSIRIVALTAPEKLARVIDELQLSGFELLRQAASSGRRPTRCHQPTRRSSRPPTARHTTLAHAIERLHQNALGPHTRRIARTTGGRIEDGRPTQPLAWPAILGLSETHSGHRESAADS